MNNRKLFEHERSSGHRLSRARAAQRCSWPVTNGGSPMDNCGIATYLFCGFVDERSQSRALGQESNPRQFDLAPRPRIEPPTMNHTYASELMYTVVHRACRRGGHYGMHHHCRGICKPECRRQHDTSTNNTCMCVGRFFLGSDGWVACRVGSEVAPGVRPPGRNTAVVLQSSEQPHHETFAASDDHMRNPRNAVSQPQ